MTSDAAWPFLEVEPRRYRFVLVEGSVSRAFALSIVDANGNAGPPIWVIGTEEGYLDAPIEVDAATGARRPMSDAVSAGP